MQITQGNQGVDGLSDGCGRIRRGNKDDRGIHLMVFLTIGNGVVDREFHPDSDRLYRESPRR